MPITATNIDTTDTVELVQGQRSERNIGGQTNVNPLPGDTTDEALLTDFKAEESGTITGIASANALADGSIVSSSDRRTALAQYAELLLTKLVPVNPGPGWDLSDSPRNETIGVVFTNVRVQFNERQPFTMQYSCDFDRGDGINSTATIPSVASVSPSSSATLDGVDLGPLESWSETVQQETKVTALTFEDIENNTITTQAGPVRRITISGRPTTNRDTIDDKAESLKGSDTAVTYSSPRGVSHQVIIESYTSTRESTTSSELGQYNLELIEGET